MPRRRRGLKLGLIFRGLLPFILVELVVLGILIAFPSITLWLPQMMR